MRTQIFLHYVWRNHFDDRSAYRRGSFTETRTTGGTSHESYFSYLPTSLKWISRTAISPPLCLTVLPRPTATMSTMPSKPGMEAPVSRANQLIAPVARGSFCRNEPSIRNDGILSRRTGKCSGGSRLGTWLLCALEDCWCRGRHGCPESQIGRWLWLALGSQRRRTHRVSDWGRHETGNGAQSQTECSQTSQTNERSTWTTNWFLWRSHWRASTQR